MNPRLLGALLVTGTGLWWGWQRRSWYTRRRRTLSAFCHALARMEAELRSGDRDTWSMLEQLPGSFFQTLSRRQGELDTLRFDLLWEDTLQRAALPLRREELGLLGRPGQVLGRYDGQTQAVLLSQIRRELEGTLECARQEEQRQGRAALLLGLSLALAASAVLL